MKLTFTEWQKILPEGSIEVAANRLSINLSRITSDRLDLNSSVIESIVKILDSLDKLTNKINEDKAEPIEFVKTNIVGTSAQPKYLFTCKADINTTGFIDNLIDPTAND